MDSVEILAQESPLTIDKGEVNYIETNEGFCLIYLQQK